jgi:hypothetical protein
MFIFQNQEILHKYEIVNKSCLSQEQDLMKEQQEKQKILKVSKKN